jgi:hypothetical protein
MPKLHMHKNTLWLVFIVLVGLIATGYSITALYRVYQYSRLTQVAETTSVEWTIKKTWGDKFYLLAQYLFVVKGTTYKGQTEFTDEYYINSWAAEQKINQFKGVKWKVWYAPQKLSHSTLPLKNAIQQLY